jgi:hypothetical protein
MSFIIIGNLGQSNNCLQPHPVHHLCLLHNNQLITKAPRPATPPAAIIDPAKVPDAADALVVEFAAELVAVPLTS